MKKALIPLAILIAALALVACGGDDDDNGGDGGAAAPTTTEEATGGGGGGGAAAGGSTVQLSADPDGALAYTTDQLNAKAGNLTIDFDNPAAVSHDVAVEDSGGNELGVSDLIAEDKTTLELSNLKAGSYTFFCTVPGHREGGMEGTLTVK